ncbi:DUF397 domain-containing protein [Streptomyces sp. NPDC006332]|uniref:DUF397 domain-containing protein n=1 Tax=Streptomyces sp. NPDC006332 TaxID=3155456 RepID=UPI0033B1423B
MSIAASTAQDPLVWFTSSYSNGAGGECVECASSGERALIRDSKNARGPIVAVRGSAWCSFVQALSHGELAYTGSSGTAKHRSGPGRS